MDRSYQLFLQRTWLVMVFILFAVMIWRSHPWDPLRFYDGMTALVTWISIGLVGLLIIGNEIIE